MFLFTPQYSQLQYPIRGSCYSALQEYPQFDFFEQQQNQRIKPEVRLLEDEANYYLLLEKSHLFAAKAPSFHYQAGKFDDYEIQLNQRLRKLLVESKDDGFRKTYQLPADANLRKRLKLQLIKNGNSLLLTIEKAKEHNTEYQQFERYIHALRQSEKAKQLQAKQHKEEMIQKHREQQQKQLESDGQIALTRLLFGGFAESLKKKQHEILAASEQKQKQNAVRNAAAAAQEAKLEAAESKAKKEAIAVQKAEIEAKEMAKAESEKQAEEKAKTELERQKKIQERKEKLRKLQLAKHLRMRKDLERQQQELEVKINSLVRIPISEAEAPKASTADEAPVSDLLSSDIVSYPELSVAGEESDNDESMTETEVETTNLKRNYETLNRKSVFPPDIKSSEEDPDQKGEEEKGFVKINFHDSESENESEVSTPSTVASPSVDSDGEYYSDYSEGGTYKRVRLSPLLEDMVDEEFM